MEDRTINNGDIILHVKGLDETVDERGNMFIALRRVSWGDSKKDSLDIRKYYMSSDGNTNEKIGKGVAFLTEEGPNALTNALIKHGYGHTDDILEVLSKRKDFKIALAKITGAQLDGEFEEEFYDPADIIEDEDD
jgi:hypothetical protein